MTSHTSYDRDAVSPISTHAQETTDHTRNIFRVDSDSSLSSQNTVILRPTTTPAQESPSHNVWTTQPNVTTTESSTSPPPYTKSTKSNHYQPDQKPSLPYNPQSSNGEGPSNCPPPPPPPPPTSQLNAEHHLLKTELSSYPYSNLLNYSITKTIAFDAAINKVSRLQQHIRDIEKLDRGSNRRQRRGLMAMVGVFAVVMVTGWSLAGWWKVESDRARGEIGVLRGEMSSGKGMVETVIVSATITETTKVIEVSTSIPTPTRVRGGDEGQRQGLPLDCEDRGGGVVICGE